MEAVGRRLAPGLGGKLPGDIAERAPDVVLGLGIDRRLDVVGQIAIDRRPAPEP